ncbi:BTB/POZ domain and ankyrin repeat-containing protein NPR1-like isoform X3 [Euphorbia lathyris]|uniref:BTB/POZ domain and ankyrin repeat-containing protein NPR1-like isoform X3 n=1 Tax=Euphorbia lathyris TaxID=212925 RepID=UPI0033136C22
MDNRIGLSDSNEISNGSSTCCTETLSVPKPPNPGVSALEQLSKTLESIFQSDFDFYADAKIIISAPNREIPVHRCILSARSPFFKTVFSGSGAKEKRGNFELKELAKDFEIGFDALVAVLAYLYSGKVKPLPEGVCVCVDEDCSHVACRPAVDFMVEVLYASFTFQVPELVALYQDIVKQITDARTELGLELDTPESEGYPDKHVKRIYQALDSDDVELVRMLLKEGHTNLDDAHALHYAVAYCDAKTTTELLDLGIADINRRNTRGYTVLHVAAMRKEPKIIVSLLTKGAQPSDLTLDGRKAVQISKRLTRAADYYRSTEEGKASPKERLCIDILEQAERREPLLGEASLSLAMAGDDLRMKLLYLENRVALAKVLFPMEAKVVMDIAQVDGTYEFLLSGKHNNNAGARRTTTVDLNEAPFRLQEEHLNRMRALSKTVELGKRFFPRCSEVLNRIMDADDLSQLAYVGNDTPGERRRKKQRYMELQEVLLKAFDDDKQEFDRSTICSSSSSKFVGVMRSNGKLLKRRSKA